MWLNPQQRRDAALIQAQAGARRVQPGQNLAPQGGARPVQPGRPVGNANVVSSGRARGGMQGPPQQPPPQAAPQAQQQFSMNRPQRPEGVGRPQISPQTRAQVNALRNRPEGVGSGPRSLSDSQGPSWQEQRRAEVSQQRAQGPQPTPEEHADWYQRRTDPQGYRADKAIENFDQKNPLRGTNRSPAMYNPNSPIRPDASSRWMSGQGMILNDGTRIPKENLEEAGYYYLSGKGGTASGDNFSGNPYDDAGLSAGWYHEGTQVSNPAYAQWQSGAGNMHGEDWNPMSKAPSRTISLVELERQRQKSLRPGGSRSDYDRYGNFVGGGR